MSDVDRALKRQFGFSSFRPNQRDIVEAILSGRDVFAALPTGGGKSLCYQLPAVLLPKITLVVSPLIALMKDQVDGAREDGVAAAFLNSSLSADESRDAWRSIQEGKTRLVYASPERLALPGFRSGLARCGLSLVAVDEAHCISEWGHEFRPDYRSLGDLRSSFPDVPFAAFTATATPQVQSDVIRLLGLKKPLVVRASFDRPEIFYRVVGKQGDGDAQILDFVAHHKGQPGIVYRGTRKAVEKTAEYLAARGVSAVAYHAGLEDEERRTRQEAFVRDEVTVVVATIAFGMGIDKSNVRWVVHGDLPRSIEGYYQETGRAARDGEPADSLLLHSPSDIAATRWHIDRVESPVEREHAEERLRVILQYVQSSACRRVQLLSHFAEHHPGECGRCDVCTGELSREDFTEPARKVLSAAVRTGERFGGHHLADIVAGIATDKVMERGHQNLPTFGVGRDHERDWWLGLIRELEAGGYLVRGEGRSERSVDRRAGFALSSKGRLLLAGRESFSAQRPTGRFVRPAERGGARGAAPGGRAAVEETPETPTLDYGDQEDLFQCLKALRKRIAQGRGVPPYVVFSDKTLRIMARNRPLDPGALLRCQGVGDAKLAAYGTAFLQAIHVFCETGTCGE